ncbi:MAG TPA: helix-turn-helix domain-containing protein [Caldilineaceae bacterium]|nr:helix-turn-helix domain-containing protein [Caldilineaceae bacterium]
MEIKPIRTEADYDVALAELERLMNEGEDTPNLDRLEVLSTLIGAYEAEQYPAEKPHPVEALQYYMESRGLSRAEFSAQIGVTPHRLSEVLNRRRALSINMIRRIAEVTNIPADTLLQRYELVDLVTAA